MHLSTLTRRLKNLIGLNLRPTQAPSRRHTAHPQAARARFVALLWVLGLVLAGCGGTLFGNRASLLGAQRAESPLAAAEAYMRQYQPGELPRVFQTTRIYDRSGVIIGEMFGEGRRIWVGIDQIAQPLIDATIAVEDSTFYTNPGVDARRIAGAAIQNLQEGEIVSGASTITMQLARNLFLGPDQRYDQSMDRKVLEAGLAQELTELYEKDEILEMYLNLANYGQLAYGPEAAAQVYFGKPASELTLSEASLLAGLPQQPANLNPYENWEGARARQRVVLDLMVRHGMLTQAEADVAFANAPVLAGEPGLAPNLAPHFVQQVVEQLDSQFGPGFTRRAGFQVITTLDLELQRFAQETVTANVAELQPLFDLSNGALVALRPGSAEVLVMVGSADFANEAIAGQVNVAVSLRQPGSAIKPVLVAAALEDDLVSPASVIWDIPVSYTIGLPQNFGGIVPEDLIYRPRNYDGQFHGPVTLRTALANSYNVPMVKLLDRVGVPRMLEVARNMGLHSLARDDSWYGLSLTLGGGEVTLLDLTTAYHTLANGGVYRRPVYVQEIRNSRGEVIPPEDLPEVAEPAAPEGMTFAEDGAQVIDAAAAYLVTDILADSQARLPAFGPNNPLVLSLPAAAKTGTTNDYRDNWTVGYTRYLVAGVWAGNSDGRPMRSASGVTGAAPIWHEFMQGVLARPDLLARLEAPGDPAAWEFTPPANVAREAPEVCPPGLSCRNGGELFRLTWLDKMAELGPLGDSVAAVPSAPVYAQQGDQARPAGYCGLEGGAPRRMLLPPGMQAQRDTPLDALLQVNAEAEGEAPVMTAPQQQVMAWAVRHGAPVYLGPCDRLQDLLSPALAMEPQESDAELRVLVDMAAAGDPNAGTLSADGAVPIDAIQRAVSVEGLAGGSQFGPAAGIVHDSNCPGNYVMGTVVDGAGMPMAGVRLVLRDTWGNEAAAVSKNGQWDYGMFDFPIYGGDAPQELQLYVVDEAGNPRSAPILIPHRLDEASNAPCHHVTVQGG